MTFDASSWAQGHHHQPGAYAESYPQNTVRRVGDLKIPPLASLHAGTGSRRRLKSPIVAVIESSGTPAPSLLVAATAVRIRHIIHPMLAAWMVACGWECVTHDGHPDVVTSLSRRPSPRTPADSAFDPLRDALENCDEVIDSLVVGRRRRTLTLGAWQGTFSAGRLGVGENTREVRFDDVERFVHDARALGGLVCGAPSWFELDRLARTTVRVTPAPGNPARARSQLGTMLDVVERPSTAFARIEEVHLEMPVAIDAGVVDVAAMSIAVGGDRPGLLPEQDRLVSILLASETGAVLAPPPGSGKTVITAAALAELRPGRTIVAAPVAVLSQWAAELTTWAPQLTVGIARSVEDLRQKRRSRDVTIASHQVAARALGSSRTRLDVLVVDEAHVLLRRSDTGALLRSARHLADRAWALTGSPDERTAQGDAAGLVAWVRNMQRDAVDAGPAGAFEPIICGADGGVAARLNLPKIRIEAAPVTPTAEDLDELDRLLGPAIPEHGLQRRRVLEQRRVGIGDPLASSAVNGNRSTPSKRAMARARILSHTGRGGSVLVFSSSARVLDVVVAELNALGVSSATLPGNDARTDRVRVLSAFDEGIVSVLAVPPSSQRGVNLQRANLVVHLDLPASESEFVQRNGRAARIGSPHDQVDVLVPYLAGTVDEIWTRRLLEGDERALESLASTTP